MERFLGTLHETRETADETVASQTQNDSQNEDQMIETSWLKTKMERENKNRQKTMCRQTINEIPIKTNIPKERTKTISLNYGAEVELTTKYINVSFKTLNEVLMRKRKKISASCMEN